MGLPEPSAELRLKLVSYVMAERVPAEYDSIIAEELAVLLDKEPPRIPVPPGFEVLIIGAGVSGLCAAINLKRAGNPFTILEKSERLGGIWSERSLSGAGVDTLNHLYSFANAPYDWSMYYALRDELDAYLEHVADKFDLRAHVRFETAVQSANYDEKSRRWKVAVRNATFYDMTRAANLDDFIVEPRES
jgi:4-hydroxyacetophenone monooxygenase